MSDPADYIVLRPSADLPSGFLPPEMDGRWYDRRDFVVSPIANPVGSGAVALPAGRFEVRDDGAVAEVWTVHRVPREEGASND